MVRHDDNLVRGTFCNTFLDEVQAEAMHLVVFLDSQAVPVVAGLVKVIEPALNEVLILRRDMRPEGAEDKVSTSWKLADAHFQKRICAVVLSFRYIVSPANTNISPVTGKS